MRRIVIIGGGIIGCAIARECVRQKKGSVLILEKEDMLGAHASGRNSGVIHSGINQKPGSLKAQMCVQGSRLLREFCRCHDVPMRECGTLVMARHEGQGSALEQLYAMGVACHVPELKLMSQKEIRKIEPQAVGWRGLWSPTGAVVDSKVLVETLAHQAQEDDVSLILGQQVRNIEKASVWTTDGKDYPADHVINCAGLHADRIAHMMGDGLDYRIIPFRGDYRQVDDVSVHGMIYQIPDLRYPFLNVHVTRQTDGRVLAGPTAILAMGREAYHKEWCLAETCDLLLDPRFYRMALRASFLRMALAALKTSCSLSAFRREIEGLVGPICNHQLGPLHSGIRAQLVDLRGRMVDDFLVLFRKRSTHVLNAVSPGMTSSLAFAKYVVNQLAYE